MSCVTEVPISWNPSANTLVQDIKKTISNNEGSCKVETDETKSSITELFPWICEFRKMCRCIHADRSMASLTELMYFYVRNVSISVHECYTKPLRAAKLKDSISETLLLFLYIYRELSEDHDRYVFLNNMSDLLAMYIDMELKASRKSKEEHGKICARLTSCLYVYLEHSTEHLLDTLIKIQFMCRSYYYILDPIITKIIKSIPIHPESNVMYVRYFLIYRLWRKINADAAVKNQITTSAITSLGPPPDDLPPYLSEDILAKVPKSQPNSTKFLLQHKFDVKKTCELFLQFCRDRRQATRQAENASSASSCSLDRTEPQMLEHGTTCKIVENQSSNVNSIVSDTNRKNESSSVLNDLNSLNVTEQSNSNSLGPVSNVSAPSKSIKSSRHLHKKCKKSSEIILIDLTTDVAFEKCIKKRKAKKVAWLEEVKKRIDMKAVQNSPKIKKRMKKKADINGLSDETPVTNHQLEDLLNLGSPLVTDHCDTKSLHADLKSNSGIDIEQTEITASHFASAPHTNADNEAKIPNFIDSPNDTDVQVPCTMPSPVIVAKSVSHISDSSVKSALQDSDMAKRRDSDTVVKTRSKENCSGRTGRLNEQTVIKRLIEEDTFSRSETYECVENVKETDDSKLKAAKSVTDAAHIQHSSKDESGHSNRINGHLTEVRENEIFWDAASSATVVQYNNDMAEHSSDKPLNDIRMNDKPCTSYFHKKAETRRKVADCTAIGDSVNTAEATFITKSCVPDTSLAVTSLLNCERQDLATVNCPMFSKACESRNEIKVVEQGPLSNNTMSFNVVNGDHSEVQAELEIGNYVEINDDIKDHVTINTEIKESKDILIDKRDISISVDDNSCKLSVHSQESNQCHEETAKTDSGLAGEIIYDKRANDLNKVVNEKDIDRVEFVARTFSPVDGNKDFSYESEVAHNLISRESSKDARRKLYKMPQIDNTRTDPESKYLTQTSELQENIDGLSLLASVSQHIPHLKAEVELKCHQIKVKDYAFLKNTEFGQAAVDEETDTNDSSNTVTQMCENPTAEIINRIVGIYPDDAIDKVALQVEVTSTTNVDGSVIENELPNNISHIVESNGTYDADTPSNNLATTETNIQSSKENTNVILNGETVVLLQKSPNSNLYIINKAVENARDHNSDDEISRLKDKNWISLPDDCASFEVVNTQDHVPFSLDVVQYSKEMPCQENKYAVGRSKGIKVEPEEEDGTLNLADTKSYVKKSSLTADILPPSQQVYQDINGANVTMNKSVDKRKTLSKGSLNYRQSIKQEFNNMSNHITPNCGIQGCTVVHTRPHEVVEPQHSVHIPVTHSTTLSPIYANCSATTDLCVPYHKHCTSVSCSLQINATTSLHSHTKSANSCGRSHCSCINCTYDIVTHCRQCLHPATDAHVSCIQSNPYFLPAHSPVQTSTVQEHERTKSEGVISKVYEDQLLCKIEQSLLQNSTLDKIDVKCEPEKLFKKDMDNKLPLKKRLKAHAMMSVSYDDIPIKAEKLDNYPGVPMMSIAALEALDGTQKHSTQIGKPVYELSSEKKDDQHGSYHFNSNLIRRDYYKDIHITNTHHNLAKDVSRKHEGQCRTTNDQSNNATACQESCHDRTFKTPAQCKELAIPNVTPPKRFAVEQLEEENPYKKTKKSQLPIRQTRSSKRNVPKVNYCYTDVDPEWNPSGESKRKRKKTSR